MASINVFETHKAHVVPGSGAIVSFARLVVRAFELIGDLPLNNACALFNFGAGTGTVTVTMSLGMYTLNGVNLSLINSASLSVSQSAIGALTYVPFVLSASNTISQGNIWLGHMFATSGDTVARRSFAGGQNFGAVGGVGHGGILYAGIYSVSSSNMPTTVATSAFSKDGSVASGFLNIFPYIILSS
jgi:hypothetical protein